MPILITGVTTGTACFFPSDYVISKSRPCCHQMQAPEPRAPRLTQGPVMSWLIGHASR